MISIMSQWEKSGIMQVMIKDQAIITPEARLPLTFRKQEVSDVLKLLENQSLTLVGMKRVGVSHFLRFLTYHPALRKNSKKPQIIIYLDTNDLVELSGRQFWLLLLKRLYDIRYVLEEIEQQKIIEICTKLLETNTHEELFLLEGVKEVARIYASSNQRLVIIFARFDRLLPIFSEQFFGNLQSIVDIASQHIAYVFTTYLPFQALCSQIFFSASFSMFAKTYYLKPASQEDSLNIINLFESQRGITHPPRLKEQIVELAGGHIQLLQLCMVVLAEQIVSANADLKTLMLTLGSDERILLQCDEILESLTDKEQAYLLESKDQTNSDYLLATGIVGPDKQAVFSPLFAYYLERKLAEQAVPFRAFGQLTKKETMLLTYLTDHKGTVCSRDEIIIAVWPEFEDISDWALDQLVSRLRKKLAILHTRLQIKTNRGKGYQLVEKG